MSRADRVWGKWTPSHNSSQEDRHRRSEENYCAPRVISILYKLKYWWEQCSRRDTQGDRKREIERESEKEGEGKREREIGRDRERQRETDRGRERLIEIER